MKLPILVIAANTVPLACAQQNPPQRLRHVYGRESIPRNFKRELQADELSMSIPIINSVPLTGSKAEKGSSMSMPMSKAEKGYKEQ